VGKRPSKYAKYTLEFKLRVVRACLDEHMTFRGAAKHFGLSDHSNVKNWVYAYEAFGEAGLQDGRGRGKERPKRRLPSGMSLEQENAWLKAENEYLKKLLEAERWDAKHVINMKPFVL
jgi:transposase